MARGDYVQTYAGALRQAGAELFARAASGQQPSAIAAWLGGIFPSLSGQIIGAMAANAPRQVGSQRAQFAAGTIPAVPGWAREVKADLPRSFRYVTVTISKDPETGRMMRLPHIFDSATELSGAELREGSLAESELLKVARQSPGLEADQELVNTQPEFQIVRVQERGPLPAT